MIQAEKRAGEWGGEVVTKHPGQVLGCQGEVLGPVGAPVHHPESVSQTGLFFCTLKGHLLINLEKAVRGNAKNMGYKIVWVWLCHSSAE